MNAVAVANTKEKILHVAHEMFSSKGFHGTSIRDISKEAGVNVSAINYHFENKEKLYWETFQFSYRSLDQGIRELAEKHKTSEDLAFAIFEYLLREGSALVNTFKMMLNDNFSMPDDFQNESDHNFGPPGGETIYQKLHLEMPEGTSKEALIWAVRGIFTYVTHWALMMNTSYCKDLKSDEPDFTPEGKKRSITLHIKAMKDFIMNHPENWN